MAVYFHGNFGLNRHYMSKLTARALKYPALGDAGLAKPFRYEAPFATKYRYWLHKTGIANLGRPFTLTESGRVVWEHDPDFNAAVTKWFMHHELTSDQERAEAWHFFIHEFKPKNEAFTRNDLREFLMMKMRYHHEEHFGQDSKMLPIIVRKILECYTKPEALGDLGLLKSEDGGRFHFAAPRQRGPWKTPKQLTNAYKM